MNAVRDFLAGTIQDLRERRLLPVAGLLAIAIVAAPVVLMKHGGGAQAAPAMPPTAPQQLKPLTALANLDKLRKPSLRALGSKDPFGGRHIPKLTSLAKATEATGPSTQSGSSTGSSGSGGGGSTLAPVTGGGTPPVQAFKAPTARRVYTYKVDVAFGDPQDPRKYRGLKRFAMLPDTSAPLLVFLGVNSGHSKALFLVDASLSPSGEGRCGDSGCSFIELGPGNEETFTDQGGRHYLLRLDQIRKVRVRAHSSASRPRHANASSSDNGDTQPQSDGGASGRRFLSPLFGDRIENSVQP